VPAARATHSIEQVILDHERDDLVATVVLDATGTVCILSVSKWQSSPYPVVFLKSCHAIPYINGTRSLSGSSVLTFPEWLKEHEILESSVLAFCSSYSGLY